MLKCWKKIVVIITACLLQGCVVTQYGVPISQWEQLDEAQKVRIITDYNEKERREHQERLVIARGVDDVARSCSQKSIIEVQIQDGKVRLNGKRGYYKPLNFTLYCGEKKIVNFQEQDTSDHVGNKNIDIQVEYRDGYFMFDTRNERLALQMKESDVWSNGYTYRNVSLNSHSWSEAQGITIRILNLYRRNKPFLKEERHLHRR
ncbi:hypothetical protein ISS03_03760 [Patescibacteria group bacterium]|nr:hypothetical protein [Patescibacteria group bacterium]